jgi:hypothetical protein
MNVNFVRPQCLPTNFWARHLPLSTLELHMLLDVVPKQLFAAGIGTESQLHHAVCRDVVV